MSWKKQEESLSGRRSTVNNVPRHDGDPGLVKLHVRKTSPLSFPIPKLAVSHSLSVPRQEARLLQPTL